MKKIIMEFDPIEDKEEIQCVLHSTELMRSIIDFKSWLSSQSKYSEKESFSIGDIQSKINEIIKDNNCEFVFEL